MAGDSPVPVARRSSELLVRSVAGICLLAVAGVALWLGGIAFWLLLVVGAILMQHEWADLVEKPRRRRLAMFALSVPLAIMSPLAAGPTFLALGLIAAAFLFVCVAERGFALAWGMIYCGLPVLALLYLRDHESGLLLALWAMALVWFTDIGAYFAGRSIGGPKLAPWISPNKTWAGLGGGVVASVALSAVLHFRFGLPNVLVFASAMLAVVAQLGDLLESGLKRRAGLKDSGHLIPGHGGLLDRLDGQVPVAPLAAIIVLAMGL